MKIFAATFASVIAVPAALALPQYAQKVRNGMTVQDVLREHVKRDSWQPRDLIGGALSPLTGVLQALDLPTPQNQVLEIVPDAAHPFKAPGPKDIRGLCPTLNTMANHGWCCSLGICFARHFCKG